MSVLPEQICTDSAQMVALPNYFSFRDQSIQGFDRLDQLIQQEESKSITPNVNNQLRIFMIKQMEQINSLFFSEKAAQDHHLIKKDDNISSVLVELDGALKLNLKSLIVKLEGKSVETLNNAIQSQDKLLHKLQNIIKKIQSEDPRMCSKMDFLTESEYMFDQLTKFNEGINKTLQAFQTRETFIVDLIYKLTKEDDPIYQNQMVLQDFLFQVATKIPIGGPESVHLFKQEAFNDFGEQPFGIGENTEGEFRIIENETFIYYGEVRKDDPKKILGKGIKVLKANGELFEGWHLHENNVTGKGRWIGGRAKKIYVGDLKNNKSHGQGELRMASGDRYKGGFQNDRYEGFGTYYRVDGRYRQGIYVLSNIQGEGRITYPDGSFQVGMFVENELEGEVILTKPDGTRYRQYFVEGTQEGQNQLIE